jgi:Cu-processing system permease protein
MNVTAITAIARDELTNAVRNRWTIIFSIVFGLLAIGIAHFGMKAEGFSGMQSFTRTSASMLNLVLYIVPLVALTMGTLSFCGERGSSELLFAQPLFRSEVVIGKWLGLFFSVALSTLTGFSLAGSIVALNAGTEGLARYVGFVALSLLLGLSFLSLSVLISVFSLRKARAFGYALFCWFFLTLFYDLVVIGSSLLFSGQDANTFLFLSLFGNPVDMVRIASLLILDNVSLFGAAGAALLRFLGGPMLSIILLIAALFLWNILPLLLSLKMLRRQDI